ncbi:TIGR02530 family flagellar biosynthesis protein [Phosphitispora sp. TUW77]|uniref:TIGR02530 family flagellar biosynthesis protein n=1 Tax=Phosphitispora sp. TUW77 TaxID=3152361 RepID=UPI003AB88A50
MVDKVMYPQPILPVGTSRPEAKPQKPDQGPQVPFKDLLEAQIASGGVKFSSHAQQRMEVRNIRLTGAELAKISSAVDKAAQKGARDSLIMMNNLAFVVSVKNKTVITAMDDVSMKEHVFTNIDSAVIV